MAEVTTKAVKELLVKGDYRGASRMVTQLRDKSLVTEWKQRIRQAMANDDGLTTAEELINSEKPIEAMDLLHSIKSNPQTLKHHAEKADTLTKKIQQGIEKETAETTGRPTSEEEAVPFDAEAEVLDGELGKIDDAMEEVTTPLTSVPEEVKGTETGRLELSEPVPTETSKDEEEKGVVQDYNTPEVPEITEENGKVLEKGLGNIVVTAPTKMAVKDIAGPYPWKRHHEFIASWMSFDKMMLLARSLQKVGMQDPIHLVKGDSKRNELEQDGVFYVILGTNRFEAASRTKRYKEEVPVVGVSGFGNYFDIFQYALANNFNRKNITETPEDKYVDKEYGRASAVRSSLARGNMCLALGYDPDDLKPAWKEGPALRALENAIGVHYTTLAKDIKLVKLYAKKADKIDELAPKGLTKVRTTFEIQLKKIPKETSTTNKFTHTFKQKQWDPDKVIEWINDCLKKDKKKGVLIWVKLSMETGHQL